MNRVALAIALAACTPPRAPRPPIAQEPVRSAEEIANEHRALSHEERTAAISLTIEHFLVTFRKDHGEGPALTVVLQKVDFADAPQIVGVTYAKGDVSGETRWFLTIAAPMATALRELVIVPIEIQNPGDGPRFVGDCAVHVPEGAAAWLEFCHYDSGHDGD